MSTLDVYNDSRLDTHSAYPAHPAIEPALLQDSGDAAPPLLGIAFAVALSIPLWMIIGAAIWLFR